MTDREAKPLVIPVNQHVNAYGITWHGVTVMFLETRQSLTYLNLYKKMGVFFKLDHLWGLRVLLYKLCPKMLPFLRTFHQIFFLIISSCSLNTFSDQGLFYLNVDFIVGKE